MSEKSRMLLFMVPIAMLLLGLLLWQWKSSQPEPITPTQNSPAPTTPSSAPEQAPTPSDKTNALYGLALPPVPQQIQPSPEAQFFPDASYYNSPPVPPSAPPSLEGGIEYDIPGQLLWYPAGQRKRLALRHLDTSGLPLQDYQSLDKRARKVVREDVRQLRKNGQDILICNYDSTPSPYGKLVFWYGAQQPSVRRLWMSYPLSPLLSVISTEEPLYVCPTFVQADLALRAHFQRVHSLRYLTPDLTVAH